MVNRSTSLYNISKFTFICSLKLFLRNHLSKITHTNFHNTHHLLGNYSIFNRICETIVCLKLTLPKHLHTLATFTVNVKCLKVSNQLWFKKTVWLKENQVPFFKKVITSEKLSSSWRHPKSNQDKKWHRRKKGKNSVEKWNLTNGSFFWIEQRYWSKSYKQAILSQFYSAINIPLEIQE